MPARVPYSLLATRLITIFLMGIILLPLQGCGFLEQWLRPEPYKPIVSPSPAPAAPLAPANPTPAPKPAATPPAEAARPGNPMSWGEAGKMGVGREFDAVYFNNESTELDLVAKGRLDGYAAWLKERPQVWVTLAGHADRHNPEEYAFNLGMARALAVAEYLAGRGLEAKRLYTISYGQAMPASEGTEAADDALNSRVEVLGFVAPAGQDAPVPAAAEKESAPEAEKPVPPALGRDLTR